MRKMIVITVLALLIFSACSGESLDMNERTIENKGYAPDMSDTKVSDALEIDTSKVDAMDTDMLNTPEPLSEIIEEICESEIIESIFRASWAGFGDMNQILMVATDIFRGEVLDERMEWVNTVTQEQDLPEWFDPYRVMTLYHVRVIEVFHGDTQPGDIVVVAQEGGQVGNVRVVNSDKVPIAIGDELVFAVGWTRREGSVAHFLNPWQSVYNVASLAEGARAMGFDEELEPVNPVFWDAFAPSLGDLVELTIENFGEEAAFALEWVDEAELQEYLYRR